MYRDVAHFGGRDQTLTERILSTKQDIKKQWKAFTLYGATLLYELNMQKTPQNPLFALNSLLNLQYKILSNN